MNWTDLFLPEITLSVASQPKRKAAGPDGITNEAWKTSFGMLWYTIFQFFSFRFESRTVSDQWRIANIIALFRGSGNKLNPTTIVELLF